MVKEKATCASTILREIGAGGVLSRAAISKATPAYVRVKTALAKLIREGRVVNEAGSYRLGTRSIESMSADARDAYEAAVEGAIDHRAHQRSEREASRTNAEAGYAKRLEAAGGLTHRAKQDQR
jgi:hypothetical protein